MNSTPSSDASLTHEPGGAEPSSDNFFSNLRYDLPSALAVALVALPLCLGIAVASGAPAISGIIAGIVGGIVVGAFSGSHTSVSGPAAGLTAVIIAALLEVDFEVLLIAIIFAGLLQIGFGFLRFGFIVDYFPTSVIRGLLAAIGLILIFKQLPHAFGLDKDPEGDFSFFQPDNQNTLTELLNVLGGLVDPAAIIISSLCLATIILWDMSPLKKLVVPSSLIAVVLGVVINMLFHRFAPGWALQQEHLVDLPDAGIGNISEFLIFPDFAQVFGTSEAVDVANGVAANASATSADVEDTKHAASWGTIIKLGVELSIVASLESLLNIEAIDKLDPKKRHSPPNRELVAQGLGNVTAGLIGGLPVTSVVVRSSMNVHSGSRSKSSAVMHGVILLAAVLLIPTQLEKIPLASLAAILLIVGYKLASFKVFKDFYDQGWPQFLPFLGTVLAIFFSDLMWGIGIGLLIGLFFVLRGNSRHAVTYRIEQNAQDEIIKLKLARQVTFLNRANLIQTLESLKPNSEVVIDASASEYIDADIINVIKNFAEEEAPVKGIKLRTIGFADSTPLGQSQDYVNVVTKETQQKLTPERVLELLKLGNERFVAGDATERDLLRQARLTAGQQNPWQPCSAALIREPVTN